MSRTKTSSPRWTVLAFCAAAVLVPAAMALWLMTRMAGSPSAMDDGGPIGGPYTLVSDRGAAVTDRSFPGRYTLLYFGYTRCPDVCPDTMNALAAALDRLGPEADRVQPLFVTLDPAHDTPAVLHRFVAAFTPRLIGLTGTAADIGAISRAYHVVAMHTGGDDGPAMAHSSVLYLMAPDGRFVAPIPADAPAPVMARVLGRGLDGRG